MTHKPGVFPFVFTWNFLGLLKVEKIAHGAFAASSKAYITFQYGSMEQVQNIADILAEYNLLRAKPTRESCLFDGEITAPIQQAKTKGNNNLLDIDELVFLNVILGRERNYAVNRGIRKQLNTSEVAIYSQKKETVSGLFSDQMQKYCRLF